MITVFRSLDLGLKAYMLYDDVSNDADFMPASTASKVLSAAGFLLQTLGYVAEGSGLAHQHLKHIKTSEFVVRVIDLPVKAFDGIKSRRHRPDIDFKTYMNRAVLVPYLTFIRSASEMEITARKAYFELSEEKRAAATKPIYEWDGLFYTYRGEAPVDADQMQEELQNLENFLPVVHFCQVASNYKDVRDREKHIFVNAMQQQSGQLRSLQNRHDHNLRVLNVAQRLLAQHNQRRANQNVDPFDLTLHDEIPEFLEDDDVFSRYVCPITLRPIRDPVGDPTTRVGQGMTLYERSALSETLQNNQISPTTNLPLDEEDLVEQPFIRALIDDRLRFFSLELKRHAQNQFRVPADPQKQLAAQQENTRYQ